MREVGDTGWDTGGSRCPLLLRGAPVNTHRQQNPKLRPYDIGKQQAPCERFPGLV